MKYHVRALCHRPHLHQPEEMNRETEVHTFCTEREKNCWIDSSFCRPKKCWAVLTHVWVKYGQTQPLGSKV